MVAGVTRTTGETLILTFEAALRVVDKICFTRTAFAAVLKDGSVVTWGSRKGSNKVQLTVI